MMNPDVTIISDACKYWILFSQNIIVDNWEIRNGQKNLLLLQSFIEFVPGSIG